MYNKTSPMMGFAGQYQFVKYKVLGQDENGEDILSDGNVVLPWFDNMILDQGLDYLGSQTWDNLSAVHLGTGNTAPTGSETSISGYVAGASANGIGGEVGISGDSTYLYRRISKRFAAGSASGVNLASVAVGNRVADGEIFSLSLLKDTGGNPTTLTLEADEVLDVVYELRMYLPPQDLQVSTTIDGVASTVTIRRATDATRQNLWASSIGRGFRFGLSSTREYGVSASALPAAASFPNGSLPANRGSVAVSAYSPGSYTLGAVIGYGLLQGNFAGGIGCVFMDCGTNTHASDQSSRAWGCWAYGFSPKLNKDAERTATVSVGLSWGRYTP